MEQAGGQIVLFIIILTVLGFFLVLLFLIFLKRKNTIIKNKKEAEQFYKLEITKTQIEIREETLRNISWELHDNIGQLMTLAKIQAQNAQDNPEKIEAVSEIIGKGLNELRALSKSINPNIIRNLDLHDAIKAEIERFNRLNFIEAELSVAGDKIDIDPKVSVILFRILQEFFSNTIKHSKATKLFVTIIYSEIRIEIFATDNGVGIHKNAEEHGQGLTNMRNRAKLIDAELDITSIKEKGTSLEIRYSIRN